MAKNRVLLKHAMVGAMPVAYRCSECGHIFPVPGGALTDQQKAEKVQAAFDSHNCHEDASQAAARIVREATSVRTEVGFAPRKGQVQI
jgi:hypothetical protein